VLRCREGAEELGAALSPLIYIHERSFSKVLVPAAFSQDLITFHLIYHPYETFFTFYTKFLYKVEYANLKKKTKHTLLFS
jgi:hypothetical protein